jgi:methylmalonyl-CoA mutase cobalamin-binding subunit
MLKQALTAVAADVEIASRELLSAEAVSLAAQRQAPIVVIASMQPGGHAQLRYLCKRLRRALPDVKIAAGTFAERGLTDANRESLREAGADVVVVTIVEARDQMLPWIQLAQSTLRAQVAGASPSSWPASG